MTVLRTTFAMVLRRTFSLRAKLNRLAVVDLRRRRHIAGGGWFGDRSRRSGNGGALHRNGRPRNNNIGFWNADRWDGDALNFDCVRARNGSDAHNEPCRQNSYEPIHWHES